MVKEDLNRANILKKNVMTRDEIQQLLIDNFISLQKVMTNLSIKFDELSTNISKLLQLFEISAKTFAERYSTQDLAPQNVVDTDLIKKLNNLLDQNKVISKGIMLIEEKLREKDNIFDQPQSQFQQQYSYPTTQQTYRAPQPTVLPSMQPQQSQQPASYKKR